MAATTPARRGRKPDPRTKERRRESNRVGLAARYAARKKSGICPFCPMEVSGRVICIDCQAKSNERCAERYELFKAWGICVACGLELAEDGVLGPGCREKYRGRRHVLRKPLTICAEPVPVDAKAILALPLVDYLLRKLERRAA